jgi:hypothetical protein
LQAYQFITNTLWVAARLCKLQKRCTRLAAASDKVYQSLAHGRWFSPASSTTKTGHHDVAEILLKVALNTKKSINQSKVHVEAFIHFCTCDCIYLVHWFVRKRLKSDRLTDD